MLVAENGAMTGKSAGAAGSADAAGSMRAADAASATGAGDGEGGRTGDSPAALQAPTASAMSTGATFISCSLNELRRFLSSAPRCGLWAKKATLSCSGQCVA